MIHKLTEQCSTSAHPKLNRPWGNCRARVFPLMFTFDACWSWTLLWSVTTVSRRVLGLCCCFVDVIRSVLVGLLFQELQIKAIEDSTMYADISKFCEFFLYKNTDLIYSKPTYFYFWNRHCFYKSYSDTEKIYKSYSSYFKATFVASKPNKLPDI